MLAERMRKRLGLGHKQAALVGYLYAANEPIPGKTLAYWVSPGIAAHDRLSQVMVHNIRAKLGRDFILSAVHQGYWLSEKARLRLRHECEGFDSSWLQQRFMRVA